MDNVEILSKIVMACSEKEFDITIQQEGDKTEIEIFGDKPRYLRIKIPNIEDKNTPIRLLECLEKIKAIPS